MTSKVLFALTPLLALVLASPVHADDASQFASGVGALIYVAAGTLASSFEVGSQGKVQTARTVDALLTTGLFTEALKATVHEKRPRSQEDNSFPSAHASLAFTVATMQSHYHPKQAPLWYLGATAIGVSRVTLHRHHVHDVVAGAALGYFTSKLELHAKHGLILSPFIRRFETGNTSSRGATSLGLGITGTF